MQHFYKDLPSNVLTSESIAAKNCYTHIHPSLFTLQHPPPWPLFSLLECEIK